MKEMPKKVDVIVSNLVANVMTAKNITDFDEGIKQASILMDKVGKLIDGIGQDNTEVEDITGLEEVE